ncbi:hypothetical protein FHR83_006071 [Actinoplanes campanulatus]|uniref:Immunity protein 74 n=1 Tax=Actinoplanes campanulatus TaxID=113559 RepID=A0A7W5ALM9_9ACTN|nr:hypothetical protein [Actinoplanes campanulatus]MBB3098376.1 hypothetical protein [Actinoplanes campanulatus]GGN34096.1 hypothetical protein GCM10010109_56770 [Actinoplanes campanulatus]GID38663.1 hypothetical protein Aca09nite_51690 [Actinoplanes campanulatus]
MGVEEIRSQAARTDTGVVLRSVDRETLRADYRGHSMVLPVDRGIGSYGVYLPRVPVWDDGEPIAADDLAVIRAAVVEVLEHWGTLTEFITLPEWNP